MKKEKKSGEAAWDKQKPFFSPPPASQEILVLSAKFVLHVSEGKWPPIIYLFTYFFFVKMKSQGGLHLHLIFEIH